MASLMILLSYEVELASFKSIGVVVLIEFPNVGSRA